MKKNTNVLMASLLVLALVLGVILIAAPSHPAQASGMINVTPGVTLLTAGRADGLFDYLVVIDKSSEKILVYNLTANNEFNLVAAQDYNKVFAPPANTPTRNPSY